jgi:hypothetical protein
LLNESATIRHASPVPGPDRAQLPRRRPDAEGEPTAIYQISTTDATRLPQIAVAAKPRITAGKTAEHAVGSSCPRKPAAAELVFRQKPLGRGSDAHKSFAARGNAEYCPVANVSVDKRKPMHQLCERL